MTREQQPLLVSRTEAQEMLGLGRSSLRKLMETGTLQRVKLKGLRHWHFRRSDVEKIVQGK